MAVQAEQSASAVPVVRRKRRGQLGWVGGIAVTGAALAALYLVMAPLLALLATAFRGPSDLLPFEPGAHWTLANLADVYLGTNLLTKEVGYRLGFGDQFHFSRVFKRLQGTSPSNFRQLRGRAAE